jgi:hypothetical protein
MTVAGSLILYDDGTALVLVAQMTAPTLSAVIIFRFTG